MTLLPRHKPCCPASDALRWRRGSFATPASPQEALAVQGPMHQPPRFCSLPQGLQCWCMQGLPHPHGALCSPCPRWPPAQTLLLQPPSLTWSPPILAGLCTLCVQTCGEGCIYTWATGHIYTVHIIYIYIQHIYIYIFLHSYIYCTEHSSSTKNSFVTSCMASALKF